MRFIPTRAGNTMWCGIPAPKAAVHPHSRGEHVMPVPAPVTSTGSSPLARGTLVRGPVNNGVFRFIPTRAGNTTRTGSIPSRSSVHPHSRGEHVFEIDRPEFALGSSPLARGTRIRAPHRFVHGRFIPTRAGNTIALALRAGILRGSSPLARGTRPSRRKILHLQRFIPTRAGNTMPHSIVTC